MLPFGTALLPFLMLLVFHLAVSTSTPNWHLALLASRVALASGMAAIVTSVLIMIRARVSRLMLVTLLLGGITAAVSGMIEILAHACFTCF